jgi:ABC-2 type transport system ATP-binding protein
VNAQPAVRTRELTHRFGALTALDHVDLEVAPGEIYGFLGRNGAGKTTLIRALLGLVTPTSGTVHVLGTPVRGGRTPSELWGHVGYLVEGPGLYPSLTVFEHLQLAAHYRRLPAGSVARVVEQLDLGRYGGVRTAALSLGNRQRLGLALALVHRPELVILDEPVNGLDPAGVVDVRNMLRRLTGEGVTVFMSTHLISEVARLADRVGIIHAGRLIAELSGERLHSSGDERLVSTFRTASLAARGVEVLSAHGLQADAENATVVSTDADAVRRPERIATLLVEAGAPPMSLGIEHEDLERYFLRLTEEAAQ